MVNRQDSVRSAGHDYRRNTLKVSSRTNVPDATLQQRREPTLLCRLPLRRIANERAQTHRTVYVVIRNTTGCRHRNRVLKRPTYRPVVNQAYPCTRRYSVHRREQGSLNCRIEGGWGVVCINRTKTETADVIHNRRAAIGIRVGHGYRLRHTHKPVRRLQRILLLNETVVIDALLRFGRLLIERIGR